MVFGPHPTVDRVNRDGREYMRADADEAKDRFRNQQRALRIAQLLFNMQHVVGIEGRIEDLRVGKVESTVFELEAAALLVRRAVRFRFVTPVGTKGSDFDGEITLPDGTAVNCEMKCKVEGTDLTKGTELRSLKDARQQLPNGSPAVAFLKIPEEWIGDPRLDVVMSDALAEFFRNTERVVAVIVQWEQLRQLGGGALFEYRFRVERGTSAQARTQSIDALLGLLQGPPSLPGVSFREAASDYLRTAAGAR